MKMTEMIIKIPEETRARLALGAPYMQDIQSVCYAINKGTILPKGHGRLIDADKLKTHFVSTEQGTDLEVYLQPTIIDAPTIIEAYKEENEK